MGLITHKTEVFEKKWFSGDSPKNAKKASAQIGAGTNGTVTVKYDKVGTEGNDFTVIAENGDGVDVSLSAALDGNDIIVTLGTTPVVEEASATAQIGEGEEGTIDIEVDLAGEAGNGYSIIVEDGDGNNQALAAAEDEGLITVTLGTNESGDPSDTKNIASLVATAISTVSGITATATGDGSGVITSFEEVVQFSGGADADEGGDPDDTKNRASLVASEISKLSGFTATASGNGTTAIEAMLEEKEFEGGQFATPAKCACAIQIIDTIYMTSRGGDKYDEELWYEATPALITED